MTESQLQYFKAGEKVIIQSSHPSVIHLWGQETIVYEAYAPGESVGVMGELGKKWCYKTDIQGPPETDDPKLLHLDWLWYGYELKKKYESGAEFESLILALIDSPPDKVLGYSE